MVKRVDVLKAPCLMSTTFAGEIEGLDAMDEQLEGLVLG